MKKPLEIVFSLDDLLSAPDLMKYYAALYDEMDPRAYAERDVDPLHRNDEVLGLMTDEMKKVRMMWYTIQDDRDVRLAKWDHEISNAEVDTSNKEFKQRDLAMFEYILENVRRDLYFIMMRTFGLPYGQGATIRQGGIVVKIKHTKKPVDTIEPISQLLH